MQYVGGYVLIRDPIREQFPKTFSGHAGPVIPMRSDYSDPSELNAFALSSVLLVQQ